MKMQRNGGPHCGRRVISARISNLYRPEQAPLGGISVDDVYRGFTAAGTIQKIVCCCAPKTGPPLVHVDALVQFELPDSAQYAVESWNAVSLTGDNNNLLSVHYSVHSELQAQPNNRCRDYTTGIPGGTVQGTPSDDSLHHHEGGRGNHSTAMSLHGGQAPQPMMHNIGNSTSASHVNSRGEQNGRMVHVKLSYLYYPQQAPLAGVTIDRVYEVFSYCGQIHKIACNSSPKLPPFNHVDVLVQFTEHASAAKCVQYLNGLSLTDYDHNWMEIEWSKNEDLCIKVNSVKSRDLTLPCDASTSAGAQCSTNPSGTTANWTDGDWSSSSASNSRVVAVHISQLSQPHMSPLGGLTVEAMHAAFSIFGFVERITCSPSSRHPGAPLQSVDVFLQFQVPEAAASAISLMSGKSLTGDAFNMIYAEHSRHNELVVHMNTELARDYTGTMGTEGALNSGGDANMGW